MPAEEIPSRRGATADFLDDCVATVLRDARAAVSSLAGSRGSSNERFDAGVVQGYWEVLTTLRSRAEIHGVRTGVHEFNTLDPDEFLWGSADLRGPAT